MKHVVLIVEDDPGDGTVLRGIVESTGNLAWHVTSLEEARAAMAKGGYCCVVLSAGMADSDAPRSRANRGVTLLEELRARDKRRNDDGHHVLPILVCTGQTGQAQSTEDLDQLYLAGANGVVAKPLVPRRELLGRKIGACLARAGREDHAACGGVAVDVASRRVHVVLTGERVGRRSGFRLNGEPCDMQNGHFVVFLRFGVAHLQGRGGWSARHQLGITQNKEIPSRITRYFKGKVPPGFTVIEADWVGNFRLNPEIVVELDLAELEKHPYAAVRKIAKEEGELRARKKRKRGE